MTDSTRSLLVRRAVAALVLLAFSLSTAGLAGVALGVEVRNPFEPDRTVVYAEFERAVGLYDQSRVFADGVEIGEVTGIDVLADRVRVELTLHDAAIRADTEAILRLRSLIGERYVELTKVWTGDGERLESGDVVPLERTVVPAEITEVLDEAARVSKELDGETMNRVIGELAAVVDDDGAAVEGLLDELANAGEVVASQADDLDQLITSLDTAVATLAEKDQTVVSVLRNGTMVSQALLTQQGALDAAVGSIDTIVGDLATFTGEQRQGLTDLAADLSTVGQLLAKHRTDFEQVVHYLPMASYGFARAITHDGDRWYLQPQVTGTLVAPFVPNINSRGGIGSEENDDRFVPGLDFNDSIVRDVIPWQVDTTGLLGTGPLLPSLSLGPLTIDADGSGSSAP
ncbi:MAG TPA: MCE family protein [Acidimicrobiales bacterium]|nr:MCE family protein [Acidimicrobiales bacterium]